MQEPPYSLGKIRTPHGTIRTPALIPVIATSYGIWDKWINGEFTAPWELAQSAILSLYHVLQYGRKDEVLQKGIHDVLHTKNPIWMDSGGFQYMKKGAELEPLDVLHYQGLSGCDIGVTFDYPITPSLGNDEKMGRLKRSVEAANLMLSHNKEMKLYGAIHGSTPNEIEEYSTNLDSGFDGYAVGSLVPRKSQYVHLVDIIHTARNTTKSPLHAFGITGFPALYALSYLGVDTFDSWTYVVAAAYKEFIHPEKLTRVKNLKTLSSLPECNCSICQEYGLMDFLQPTSEGEILLALHNLNIFLQEMKNIREAMEENELESYIIQKGKAGNRNISIAFKLAQKKAKEGKGAIHHTGT